MNGRSGKELRTIFAACFAAGVLVDFAFNGIFVGFLFKQPFTEKLSVFYIPLFLTVAMTIANRLMLSRWRPHTLRGVAAFVAGATLGHFVLVGHRSQRTYAMKLGMSDDTLLLRSDDWPQVLFVRSARVKQELARNVAGGEVPVTVDVVTDYGCDRSAVVSTVAGVDVRQDDAATWTWQIDRSSTGTALGPGLEDSRRFWCSRNPAIKGLEYAPGTRFWEKAPPQTVGAPARLSL